MAKQSVTTATNADIPGWNDVLTHAADYGSTASNEHLRRIEKGASNIMEAVLHGMAVVGEIQWKMADHPDWPMESNEVREIGVLQAHLAELVTYLRTIEHNARYHLHEMELANARTENIAA